MSKKYKIGLDISGGDFAPLEIVRGAILAKDEVEGEIVLIGDEEEASKILKREGASGFNIISAPEKIEMAEAPAASVRRKRNSSIVVGIKLLKEKKIDAFVSCGNTGAVVCASTLLLGPIEEVERPGIAILLPTQKGVSLLIDAGANIGTKPLHLLHYGVMASVYYKIVLGKENPSVGLLNIGEEKSKGPEYVRSVHKLFSLSELNFIGNLEAKDILSGKCDCIVCDGFIGNIALKVAEGSAEVVGKFFLDTMKRNIISKLCLFVIKEDLRKFKRIIDYAEYGGAPLLGVNGIVIIGHGRSNALAVKNAIGVAISEVSHNLNTEIRRRINEVCKNNRVREILAA